MRIIKLSTKEFGTAEEVVEFFEDDLPQRKPPGRFQVTRGRIAEDKFDEGEPLVFSFLGEVMYTARAGTELLKNDDKWRRKYPQYFCVDMETVRPTHLSLKALEFHLRRNARRKESIVQSQGWPTVPDTAASNALWLKMRGEDDPES